MVHYTEWTDAAELCDYFHKDLEWLEQQLNIDIASGCYHYVLANSPIPVTSYQTYQLAAVELYSRHLIPKAFIKLKEL